MDQRKVILKAVKKVIDIARSREIVIRTLCGTDWCRKLEFLPAETLIKKFKFVVGNCKFSTIYVMFKKGVFSTNSELMRHAADCIKRRNLSGSTRADEILQGKNAVCRFCFLFADDSKYYFYFAPEAQKSSIIQAESTSKSFDQGIFISIYFSFQLVNAR